MACPYCEIIQQKKHILYEDDKVVAFLPESGAVMGEVVVVPKEHRPIIEEVPDFVVGHAMVVANKVSVSIFEALSAHGTNILVSNGIPAGQTVAHFSIRVIPRSQNDGLNLQWQPKQLSEEEMSTVELLVKEVTGSIGGFEKEKQAPVQADSETQEIKQGPEDNYMIKQLRRMP